MELITGKNKENFIKWYVEDYRKANISDNTPRQIEYSIKVFLSKRFEEQSGVITAFYDSFNKIDINIQDEEFFTMNVNYSYEIQTLFFRAYKSYDKDGFKSRPEALKAAYLEINKIINKKL